MEDPSLQTIADLEEKLKLVTWQRDRAFNAMVEVDRYLAFRMQPAHLIRQTLTDAISVCMPVE